MVYNNSAKRNGGYIMPDIILRKCGGCSDTIEINRGNVADVLYYKNKYYHSKCFCEIAEKRSKAKRSTAVEWQTALDNLWELEADTKKMLESAWIKDDLNDHLLSNYDIAAVPTRFWQIVADLGNGTYKGKRCKPVSMETLLGAWKWGQKRLNGVNAKNKTSHKGPKNDSDRVVYDLAILIGHMGDYIKYTTRTKEESAEIKSRVQTTNKINYESLNIQSKENQNDSNILDLMDDIF